MQQAPEVVPDFDAWRRGVAGVLAKARKVDVGDLPADPERLLAVTTYDGVTVSPLYTRADERPELPLPGEFPFVRGRAVTQGWHVAADVVYTDPAAANRVILDGLTSGVSAVRLRIGGDGVPVGRLGTALEGVLFELAPLALDAGADVPNAASALYTLLDGYSVDEPAQIVVSLGAAPLTSAVSGEEDVDLGDAVTLARVAADRPETVRAITVDGTVFHNAGAADAQELGAAVAAGLEYVRALTAADLPMDVALRQLEFRFAATDEQFQSVAKFRAARQLWARVAQVCGAPERGSAPMHAVTSAAMLTQRDPWVNLLRGTLAAFGAGVGGADSVTVLPFDAALPAGALGLPPGFADRMARNTQLLLLEESHVGRVQDPAAGSWYVEDLTAELAAAAWELFQDIEKVGGYSVALESGLIVERIEETRLARERDVAHRTTTVTGVNEFPNLTEPVVATAVTGSVARYGAAFEALRDRSDAYLAAHGRRPQVLLRTLGPVAENNVRATFITNLLASGGIEAVASGEAPIAVLCGSDKRYGAEAADAIAALRAAAVDRVLLAGPPKAVADLAEDDRPDGYLTARMDAVSVLAELLAKLGA